MYDAGDQGQAYAGLVVLSSDPQRVPGDAMFVADQSEEQKRQTGDRQGGQSEVAEEFHGCAFSRKHTGGRRCHTFHQGASMPNQ